MSDPKRWLADPERAPEGAAALLRSAAGPPPRLDRETHARSAARVAALAAGGVTVGSASSASAALTVASASTSMTATTGALVTGGATVSKLGAAAVAWKVAIVALVSGTVVTSAFVVAHELASSNESSKPTVTDHGRAVAAPERAGRGLVDPRGRSVVDAPHPDAPPGDTSHPTGDRTTGVPAPSNALDPSRPMGDGRTWAAGAREGRRGAPAGEGHDPHRSPSRHARRFPGTATGGDRTADPVAIDDALVGETALVAEARAALTSAPERALALVTEHARRYRNATLDFERDVIAVEALARLGRTREAQSRAADTLARGNPYRFRIARALSVMGPGAP